MDLPMDLSSSPHSADINKKSKKLKEHKEPESQRTVNGEEAVMTTSTQTLFSMLPSPLLEHILSYLDARSLAIIGGCGDFNDKLMEIANSTRMWDILDARIVNGKSTWAQSSFDRCLRYQVANELASKVEAGILQQIKVLKKDWLVWNEEENRVEVDCPRIPKWAQEPFENQASVRQGHEFFLRISMLKMNDDDGNHDVTLAWQGFLACASSENDFTTTSITLQFPTGGILWRLCGFDDFGEAWGEVEGPMITLVAVENSNDALIASNNGTNNEMDHHEPKCSFVFWNALVDDWTEFQFDDNDRLIKRTAGFPWLRENDAVSVPFYNMFGDERREAVRFRGGKMRTIKLRTERDATNDGCRLLDLVISGEVIPDTLDE